jgi:shikimate dehydrogenase
MTDRYAVIGNPIVQSKSPLIHAAFAKSTKQDLEYTKIEGPLNGFEAAVLAFRDAGGKGMNVTAPFKLQAFAMATDPHEAARVAGAANALKFDGERIEAQNFDGVGLANDIERNLGLPLAGKRVLAARCAVRCRRSWRAARPRSWSPTARWRPRKRWPGSSRRTASSRPAAMRT